MLIARLRRIFVSSDVFSNYNNVRFSVSGLMILLKHKKYEIQ